MNKKPAVRSVETQKERFARLNRKHSSFVVQLHSGIAGKWVDRAKDALHTTIEGAKEIVDNLKVCKWQIVGYDIHQEQWHTVLAGEPAAV